MLGILATAAVVLLLYGHLAGADRMPRTDAPGYLARGYSARLGLEEQGRIPLWRARSQLGYPAYTFDPPLFFAWYGLAGFVRPAANPIVLFNQLYLVLMLWLGLGVYALLRKFTTPLPAVLGAGVALAIPYLTIPAFLTGNSKLFLAYAGLAPFLLAAYDGKHPALAGLLFAFIGLSHTSLLPFAGLLLLAFAAHRAYRTRRWRSELRFAGVTLGLSLAIAAFFAVPLLVFLQQGYGAPAQEHTFKPPSWETVRAWYTGEPGRAEDGRYGLLLGLATLAALGILAWKRPAGTGFVTAWLACLTLLFSIGSLPGLANILVEFSRLEPLTLLLHGLVLGLAAAALGGLSRDARTLGILALVALTAWYAPTTMHRTTDFVSSPVIAHQLEKPNADLATLGPEHRFTTYGPPAIAFHAMMAVVHRVPVNGYGFRQGQHTDIWYTLLYNLSTEGPPADADGMQLFNLLRATNTKYIWMDICQPGGKAAYQRFLEDCGGCGIKRKDLDLAGGEDCVSILVLPNTSYAELTPFYAATEDTRTLYRRPHASRATFLQSGVPPLDGTMNFSQLPEPEPLAFSRPHNEEIRVTIPRPGWVVVKEEYFPRWQAALNGRELPLVETSLGLMAVNAPEAGELVLTYRTFLRGRVLAVISLAVLLIAAFWRGPRNKPPPGAVHQEEAHHS
jgi:hypothetical protein